MKYEITLDPRVVDDINRHIKSGNKKLADKAIELIATLADNPRFGVGKPEQLRGYDTEMWSRRINSRHRLIYQIFEDRLVVLALSAYGHYDDK